MRRSYFVGSVAVFGSVLTACTLLTSLDGFTGGPDVGTDGATDASTTDARGSIADALDDGPADAALDTGEPVGGPNLLPQGTFEGATCDPFGPFQGTASISTVAHSGNGSCRICMDPATSTSFSADDNGASGSAIVGATYRAEAWVRRDPNRPTPIGVAIVVRDIPTNGPFMDLGSKASDEIPIDNTWQRIETSYTFTRAGKVNVFVYGRDAPNACFLFDDVVLQRVN